MGKSEVKGKLERKPFRDISNRRIASSRSTKKNKARSNPDDRIESGDALDRLLLVHSDISNLLHQIDELVVQVVKAEKTVRQGRKEVESFTHVLSEMLSSLKPWVPRFQKAFSSPSMESEKQSGECLDGKISKTVNYGDDLAVQSPDPTKVEFLVSPSPLVSWRATDCTAEMGKQLFALTPLPRPKTAITKGQVLSKSVALQRFTSSSAGVPCSNNADNTANDKLGVLVKKPTTENSPAHVAKKIKTTLEIEHASPKFLYREGSEILTTPCPKMSPIKSCKLLEPSCGFSHRNLDRLRKPTPFPLGKQKLNELLDFECSGSAVPFNTSLRNSRLSGLNSMCRVHSGKKAFDASPAWFMSPPKTCILMDPSDKPVKDDLLNDKPLKDDMANDESEVLSGAFKQHVSLASPKQDGVQDKCSRQNCKSTNNLVSCGNSLANIKSTPMWKEPQSTVYKGKHPGENTLKRELWMRFEAASTNEFNMNLTMPKKTNHKGFLDMLDEAS